MKLSIAYVIFTFLMAFNATISAQNRDAKSNTIIDSLRLIEQQNSLIDYYVTPLKYEASATDSIKLIKIENSLSKEEIRKRINKCFNAMFSDDEINELFTFVQSSSYQKLFNSDLTYKNIDKQFSDTIDELNLIKKSINEQSSSYYKFEPISIKREDGFYETVDYNEYTGEFKLKKHPAITTGDMKLIEKSTNNSGSTYIKISFTDDGERKFYLLTKNNVHSHIAVVINNFVVSFPKVNSAISGGQAAISGDYSDEEYEAMILHMRNK